MQISSIGYIIAQTSVNIKRSGLLFGNLLQFICPCGIITYLIPEKGARMKKKITIGILAHVDAGKTTLSEALLYLSGSIRSLGRVDHKNTYLDTFSVERERGITIFSKQARFSTEHCDFILLDTPGHVDFSAETERTLSLLDYAILVVSAPDGIQNHTRTLWNLLEFYHVPTFIFVNKTDICIKLQEEVVEDLAAALSPLCVGFWETQHKAELDERLALVHEDFLETFLSGDPIEEDDIAKLISERRLFPCLFGSALRTTGIEFLLDTLDRYTLSPLYDEQHFGAKVYKIAHAGPHRLTYMKITGGVLSPRDELTYLTSDGQKKCEKVTQLRLYSGDKFDPSDRVSAGEICAVLGLSESYVGQGLGFESDGGRPILEPVLSYRIVLPSDCSPMLYFPKFKELEEEDPSLHLYWNEELQQIEARLMGDIQIEILVRLIRDRFGIECTLDAGKILYKETIAQKAIGIGHFEPLRHYAEVQLLLEPQPAGTGLVFDCRVPENTLDKNWQRLILSHLYEKNHRGTLTGASLTDTKITLLAGKAHLKHTEGGDFRQATLRAVRQGLMRGGCVLLEPYFQFRMELPSAVVGRAMADLQQRSAEFAIEISDEEATTLCGRGPAATLHDYSKELMAYTRGGGRMYCTPDGYAPCHNQDEIVAAVGYDPEADLRNPPHSVFCAGGAGFVVPWNEVEQYKHLDAEATLSGDAESILPRVSKLAQRYDLSADDLEAIMLREFGPIRRKQYSEPKLTIAAGKVKRPPKKAATQTKRMYIIDGYNLIYSWDELKQTADFSLEKAREVLMDVLSNFVAFTKEELTLVFDAYLVKDGMGSEIQRDGYRVVYTKENQTADAYIEKMMYDLGPNYNVKVVTGDRLVQFSAVHAGISRMTAKEFYEEIQTISNEINAFIRKLSQSQ